MSSKRQREIAAQVGQELIVLLRLAMNDDNSALLDELSKMSTLALRSVLVLALGTICAALDERADQLGMSVDELLAVMGVNAANLAYTDE